MGQLLEKLAGTSGSVLEFVQFYLSPELADELSHGDFALKHTPYDWSLNDLKPEKKTVIED